jgi:hypothetical protein
LGEGGFAEREAGFLSAGRTLTFQLETEPLIRRAIADASIGVL